MADTAANKGENTPQSLPLSTVGGLPSRTIGGTPLSIGRGKATRTRRKTKKSERSFYIKDLDEAEALDFELAQDVDGIDDEIALLRLKIKSLLENDPDNLKHIIEATNALSRLVMARYKMGSAHRKALINAIGGVLKELAVPMGIKYLP